MFLTCVTPFPALLFTEQRQMSKTDKNWDVLPRSDSREERETMVSSWCLLANLFIWMGHSFKCMIVSFHRAELVSCIHKPGENRTLPCGDAVTTHALTRVASSLMFCKMFWYLWCKKRWECHMLVFVLFVIIFERHNCSKTERKYMTRYSERYCKTLATCYWFGINTIQA